MPDPSLIQESGTMDASTMFSTLREWFPSASDLLVVDGLLYSMNHENGSAPVLVLMITDEASLMQPLAPHILRQGSLKNLLRIAPSSAEVLTTQTDILQPGFGKPTMYRIIVGEEGNASFDIHASRVFHIGEDLVWDDCKRRKFTAELNDRTRRSRLIFALNDVTADHHSPRSTEYLEAKATAIVAKLANALA